MALAGHPLLRLGFRPFFLGAGVYAVLSVLVWMGVYVFGVDLAFNGINHIYWHAHEMIYGYTAAIIAGFLLTATQNWTGLRMINGYPLLGLWSLWILARLVPFSGGLAPLWLMAALDLLFQAGLFISIATPILRVRQWNQSLILLIIMLTLVSNAVFYAGLLSDRPSLMSRGIYSGLYLFIALIIFMSGRVIPFFIERGVGYPVQLKEWPWVDYPAVGLFLAFWFVETFLNQPNLASWLAGAQVIVNAVRLTGWYTHGIWKKPLLWILFLAYAAFILALLLKYLVIYGVSPYLALHAFGYMGVGWLTLGMISRVIWGHTGRDISEPPRQLPWIFGTLVVGAIFRVGIPLFETSHYALWIGLSQACWILGFSLFLYVYGPLLVRSRPDGRLDS
jgi:uncharacterized protein involved in response to NO